MRPLDADGAPAGPIKTIPKSAGIWHPMELHLLPGADGITLVTEEQEDGSGYRRVALRRLGADGTPAPGQPLIVLPRGRHDGDRRAAAARRLGARDRGGHVRG